MKRMSLEDRHTGSHFTGELSHSPSGTRSFSQPDLTSSLADAALNALIPINRLPVDVLQMIFEKLPPRSHLSLELHPALDGYNGATTKERYEASIERQKQQWMRIASVCHLWRTIAESTATLWTTISLIPGLTPIQIAEKQLRLSREAPVDFFLGVDLDPPRVTRGARASFDVTKLDLRSLVPRLRSLHLSADITSDSAQTRQFFEQLSVCAPLLEDLTLSPPLLPALDTPSRIKYSRNKELSAESFILPTIFSNHMPRLRNLKIRFYNSWPGNTFRNLRCLCLVDQNMTIGIMTAGAPHYTASFLCDLFAANPLLEDLVLHCTLPLRSDITDPPSSSVHLSRLRTLAIHRWDTLSIQNLFSFLRFPTTCSVYLIPNGSDKDILSIMSGPFTLSVLTPCLQQVSRLYLRTRHDCFYDCSMLGAGGLEIYIKIPHSLEPTDMDAQALICPNMNVQELWVDANPRARFTPTLVARWQQLYDAMPNIRTLVIVIHSGPDHAGWECLEVLAVKSCCPNLEELRLVFAGRVPFSTATSVVRRIQMARDDHVHPIRNIVIVIPRSLEPSRTDLLSLRQLLGPTVDISVDEPASFARTPSCGHAPYSADVWPEYMIY